MTKTVLCAVDVTQPDTDEHVLREADRIARSMGAQLDVMTVVPGAGAVVDSYFREHNTPTDRQGQVSDLTRMVGKVLGEDRNKDIRHVVAKGTVYAEVLKAATLDGADLIVIGAHREDLRDFLIGPNAARIVRHATCSVYVVR